MSEMERVSVIAKATFAFVQAHFLLLSIVSLFLPFMVYTVWLWIRTVSVLDYVRSLIIDQIATSVHSRIRFVWRIDGPFCIPLPHQIRRLQRELSCSSLRPHL